MATEILEYNIGNFYQVARERDFARKFQFRVTQLGALNSGFSPSDLIYAETAALPGRQINNIQVPYMGINFNVPGVASYPGSAGYKITFRCDKDYHLRSKIEQNLFRTFDEAMSGGEYSVPGLNSVVSLTLTNKKNEGIRTYTLYGAYIQGIDDEMFDIKDTGNVVSLNCTIAYQWWEVRPFAQVPVTGRDSSGN
jgi:hypothetical protein